MSHVHDAAALFYYLSAAPLPQAMREIHSLLHDRELPEERVPKNLDLRLRGAAVIHASSGIHERGMMHSQLRRPVTNSSHPIEGNHV
jgi:hypothetical protein